MHSSVPTRAEACGELFALIGQRNWFQSRNPPVENFVDERDDFPGPSTQADSKQQISVA